MRLKSHDFIKSSRNLLSFFDYSSKILFNKPNLKPLISNIFLQLLLYLKYIPIKQLLQISDIMLQLLNMLLELRFLTLSTCEYQILILFNLSIDFSNIIVGLLFLNFD